VQILSIDWFSSVFLLRNTPGACTGYEPEQLQTSILEKFFEHFPGILRAPQLRIKHLVGAIGMVANTDKIRCSHFTQLFVNLKIPIGKKGKGDVIGFSEVIDLESRIADADADDLDPAPIGWIAFDFTVDLVDSGSLPLAVRSVHTEYLDDHDPGIDFRYGERFFSCDPEVGLLLRLARRLQDDLRQHAPHRWRLRGCQ
jgi:hypothetical protein